MGSSLSKPARRSAALRSISSRRRRPTSRTAFPGKLILVPVAALALIFGAGLPQAASPATGASANAPVAANDSATTAEDTAVDVNVLANDTDEDDDALAISTFTQGANGAVTLVAGRLRYTPGANFNGSDSFTYRTNDGTADSNVATVTVTVTEVNDLPVPLPDSKATAEDTQLTFPATDVLVNDTPGPANEAGQTLTVVSVSNGPGGAVTLSAGTIRFTPSPNYNGPASFNYRVRDNGTTNGVSAPKEWTSKVNVTVSAVNDAPVAVNDAYTATEDTPLDIAAPGVLGNDTDVDSATKTATKLSDPALGAVTLDPNGSFTYTPAPNLNGSDSFTYTVSDGALTSNVSTVTLAVAEVNDAPIANADTKATAEDTALTFPATQLSTNDSKGANEAGQTLTVTAAGGVVNGTVDLVGGTVTFTPSPDFNGVASFSYTVTDDGTTSGAADPQSDSGEVTVDVREVNDVPSAAADTLTAIEDTALSFPAADLLANDGAGPPNEAGQSLSVTAVGSPVGGTVSLDAGTVTFTPSPDFAGTAAFSYTIRDDGTTSGAADPEEATGTVTVDVGGVNDGPVAHDDAVTTPEDTTLNASVPAATDPEVDTIAYALVAGLPGLSFNADGSYTYVPAGDVHGTVSFTYRANDGTVDSNVATVTITVSEVNDAPSAAADEKATAEDTAVSFPAAELLANDSAGPADESGQALTVSSVQAAVNGTVSLVDGTITFTPSPDANGAAAFSYTVTDDGTPESQSDSGEVSVSVSEVNDAPTPAADTKTVAEDTALSFPAVDLLGNDAAGPPNEGGQSVAVIAVGSPAHGTVSLNAGTITFTPAADFSGSAGFGYTIRDNGTTNGLADAREATGTVSVTVSDVNDAAVAQDDTTTTAEDTTLNAVLPAAGEPDGDTVTYALVSGLTGLTFDLDGNYAYVPPSNFHGTVSFTYKANDGTLDSNTATVTITVTSVNDPPVAIADAYETAEDTPLSVPAPGVLENDNDIEASPLSAVLEFGPGHGTLPLNANGSLSYTPEANFHGSDTFTYRASDGSLGSNVATVTVTVTPVNDAPVAQDDAESTAEDTVLSTSVPAASEVDGDTVSYALVAGLPGLSFRADGSYTYAPPSDFHGTVSFTYKASDGILDSNVATVTITVTAVNDAPVAADDAYAVAEDGSVTIAAPGLLANDGDVDSASLTASSVGAPGNGSVTVNANGSFTYTPEADFTGSDTFTYRAGDGALQSNVATVVITVSEVNDVPVANDDAKATPEDTGRSFAASELAANDSPGAGNEAGQALSVISVQGAVNGTVSLLAGTVSFTPSADFNGAASFSYTVADDGTTDAAADPREATGTVTVSVSEVNDAPSAVDDTKTTAEDTALSFPASELVANDAKGATNEDAQGLSVSAVGGAVNGTVSLAAGTVTFTPSPDFNGDASFSYTVADDGSTSGVADAKSDAGEVSVAVSEVNDQPTAATDTKATAEDAALTFPASELLGNDTAGPPNEAGQTLSVLAVGSALGGTVSLVAGTITFTPAPDFNGPAGFIYTVRDHGTSDGFADPKQATGTVSVSVSAVNDAPLAGDDAWLTAEDAALSFPAAELAANDAPGPANEAGQSLSVISVQDAVNGTVSLVAGTVMFTPSAHFNGPAGFSYTLSDDGASNGVADAKEASGTVTVAVSAVNDAPNALDDAHVTAEDTPLSFPAADLTGNDSEGPANEAGQTLSVTAVGGALNGTVSLAAGVVTFTPDPDFNGAASFTYTVADDGPTDGTPDPRSDGGLVTVAVSEVNDTPIPVADTRGTAEDTALSFPAADLLANDSPGPASESGQSLNVVSVQEAVNGTVSLLADVVTFTPAANHTGEASFTYTLRDDGTSNGTADPMEAAGTVTVNVSEVNDAPSAIDDAKATAEDTPLSFPAGELVANDGKGPANEAGQDLSVTAVGGAVNATVSLIDGTITFTPGPDFNGDASFSYTVTDNGAPEPESDSGEVSVSVSEVNDAPSAAADTKATLEDTSLSFPAAELAANDATGPPNEGDQRLNVTSVHSPAHGTVALAAGTVTFTPSADYNGPAGFSYTVRDDGAAVPQETTGTVNVMVSAVNDVPTAADDLQATAEDTTLSFPAAELVSDDSKGPSDESGQTLTVTSAHGAVDGTVSLSAGTITFTPNPDFNGAASFGYTATDDGTTNGVADPKSDSGQVTVSVSEVNDPPRAAADAKATAEDTALSFPASGLLGNDTAGPSDESGQTLSVISVGSAVNGTVSLVDSTVTFVPSADFNGAASFAYTIGDDGTSDSLPDAKSASGIVNVTVAGVNDAPVAHDRAETTTENTTLNASVPTGTDVDGDALSYALVTGLPGLSFDADGSYAYLPPTNFSGTVSFTYEANDGTLDSNVATVTITVGAVNDAPLAVDDSYAVSEDGSLTIAAPGVLGNDSDPDSVDLTATLVAATTNGTLSLDASGSFTYVPSANFHGSDSFTYEVSDGTLDSNLATVTIGVTEVNDAPSAADDLETTPEDTALSFPVGELLANDSTGPASESGQSLTVTAVGSPVGGTISLVAGSVTFTPAPDFNGAASFNYTVSDDGTSNGLPDPRSASGTVRVEVSERNDAPTAAADTKATLEDTALSFPAAELLANDAAGPPNEAGQALSVISVHSPADGTVALAAGNVTFTPSANFNGTATFSYTLRDEGTSDGLADPKQTSGTVSVSVSAVNDAPLAHDGARATDEDTTLHASLPAGTDVDGDALTYALLAGPPGLSLDAGGGYTYVPASNFSGSVSFTYEASDGALDSNVATVTIMVDAVNDAPLAGADAYALAEDASLTIAAPGLLANDGDVDSASLSAAKVGDPANGTVSVNANGSFSYTPSADFHGADSFSYRASDGALESGVVTVTVTVTPVNDSPIAAPDTKATAEDTPLSFPAADLLVNDAAGPPNEAGEELNVIGVGSPVGGTVSLSDGTVTFTPSTNYNGTASFAYTIRDDGTSAGLADAKSASGTVNVTVAAVNDAPLAHDDAGTTNEDTPLSASLPAGTDVDGDALSYALVAGVPGLSLEAGGSYAYVPPSDFSGSVSFTYRASDGALESNVATVTIGVSAVNDAPVAAPDAYTVAEDASLTIAAPGLLANDGDVDSGSLTAVKVGNAANGTVTVNANGSFTYTPSANFTGADSFTYRASDGALDSNVATVTLTVSAVNDSPVAAPDTKATAEDAALSFPAADLLANDSVGAANESGQSLSVIAVDSPAGGAVSLAAGTVTFTPTPDFNGPASFSYTVRDNGMTDGTPDAREASAVVTVDVSEVNDVPSAVDDLKAAAEDTVLSFTASELLGNDGKGAANEGGQSLTVTAVGGAVNGTVSLVDGTVTFIPSPDFDGAASFSYTVSDDGATNGAADPQADTGQVAVTVSEVNDAPGAVDDARVVAEDQSLNIVAATLAANDSPGPANEDGQSLAVTAVGGAVNGTVTLSAEAIVFTPNADFNGSASFTYTVQDNGTTNGGPDSRSGVGTVTVTVSEANDAPIAAADTKATAEDTTLSFAASGLAANDSPGPANEGGQTLAVVSAQDAVNGTVTLADGDITFTPAPDFNGPASFTYTVQDNGASNGTADAKSTVGTVTVNVGEVNDAPTAATDAKTTPEDTALSFPAADLLANDAEGPPNEAGQALSVISVQGAAHGTVTLEGGIVTFTPVGNFNGTASFGYTIRDDGTSSDGADAKEASGIVNVAVNAVNDAPVAANNAYTTAEETPLTVPAPGVLANDSDIDSASLSAITVSEPANGTVTLNANGSFTYTPAAGLSGLDSFTYRASDGALESSVTTVTITVGAVNDAPVAGDDSYAVAEDGSLVAAAPGVLGNDSDPDTVSLTATLVATTTNGTLTLDAGGSFTYTPSANFNGSDSFTYRADDGALDSNVATVVISVTAVNDAPSAADDLKATSEDAGLSFPVAELVENDVNGPANEGGQSLTVSSVQGAVNGTVSIAAGTVTFTPAPDFNGAAAFSYTVSDDGTSNGLADPKTDSGTVSVEVREVNDAPTAATDAKTTSEDAALSFPAAELLANDAEGPPNEAGQSLSVIAVGSPANGAVSLTAGTVTFTPSANFNGAASFAYTVTDDGTSDGLADAKSASGTVNVSVSAVNDAPRAHDDAQATLEDTTLHSSLPAGTDVDGDALSYALVAGLPSLSLEADGSYSYTPASDFHGSVSFTYRAGDGTLDSNVATVTITVSAVNDAPRAANDSAATAEDTSVDVDVLANDTDVEGSLLNVASFSQGAHGSVTLVAGKLRYTPNANYHGSDSFAYRANDGALDSSAATVTVSVSEVNDSPTAGADTRATAEDTPLSFPAAELIPNDSTGPASESGQTLSVSSVQGAVNGTVTLEAGSVIFTPAPDFNGAASFRYTVTDDGTSNGVADAQSDSGTVTVEVREVNDPPTAATDTTTAVEDTTLSFPASELLTNDAAGPPNESGQTLSVISVGAPVNGTVTLEADTISFTPAMNYNGPASFAYTIRDNGTSGGASDAKEATGAVDVTVTAVNDAPLAVDNSYSTAEETPLTIAAPGVLGNDSDVDSASLSAVKVSNPGNGTVLLNASGSFTYAPAAGFSGLDSFTYRAGDGTLESSVATVTIDVGAVNDAPVAVDDAYSLAEDGSLTIAALGLLENDSDIDSATLTASKTTDPANGTVTVNANGSFTYTPGANFNGTDSFTYKAGDGVLDSNAATVTLTVAAIDDAPAAADDSATTAEDTSVDVDVLANDGDVEGSPLNVASFSQGANGSVALVAGELRYTPNADFNGSDSFRYRASDGTLDSNLATVTIAVTAVNDTPGAGADSKATSEDTAVSFPAGDLVANDAPGPANEATQTLTVTALGSPANGTVGLVGGNITFTPDPDFNGTASFSYTVRDNGTSDGAADPRSAVGTVTVDVSAVNDSPTAAADAKTTAEDTLLSFPTSDLVANDAKGPTNEAGQSLTVVSVQSAANGTVDLTAGTVTFIPAANFNGTASFAYTATDNGMTNGTPDAKSAVGTVTVNVSAVNDAPVARADNYVAVEGTPLTVDAPGVVVNDTDIDSPSLSAVKVGDAAHGTVTIGANGAFTYTPAADFSGSDSFTYKASDGALDSTVATVTIDVGAVNDAPVAVNDAYGLAEDAALTVDAPGVLGNDSDVDSASLSAIKVSNPANGVVTLNANGSLTYTPNANFNGSDSFTYKASDGSLDSSPATVTLFVSEVNDAPTPGADTRSTAEDTALSFPAAQLLANDSTGAANEEGQTLSVISVGSPVNGTVSLASGTVTFTPDPDFNGPAGFSYTVRDNGTSNGAADARSAVGTVTVDVSEVNDPPTAADDTKATSEDTALSFPAADLVANDATGPPNEAGQAPRVISVQGAAHGTVNLVGGSITFTPSANFNGAAGFTYTVRDNGMTSGDADAKEMTGTVSVSVSPVDDAPAASSDTYETAEDAQLTIPAPGVLGNDSDVDSASLTAAKIANPANGSATLNANGSLTYTPNAGFNGTDTFTYKATDGTLDSSTATVMITVRPVNDAPVADDGANATPEDTTLNAAVPAASDPDGDSLTYELVDGTPGLTFNATGSFTYVPASNFHGTRSFTYRATDGSLSSNTATITITVSPVDDAPVARDDASQTNERVPVDVNVLANDTDVEGGPLTVASFSQGAHGSVARVDGKLRYTPDAGFSGSDSFTYSAGDGALESNVANVTIDVGAVDDPPVATDQSVNTAEDGAKAITLAANDVDSGSLSYTVVAGPSHGALSGSAPDLTYTPAANYHGADSFTFEANDGTSDSNLGTVTIAVTPVDDAPVAGDRSAATAEDTPNAIILVAADVDSASLVYSVVAGPSNGALSGAPPNLTYTPQANYNGPDFFTYRASDGTTNSNVATVAITVTSVNDAPIALADAYSVDHNGTLTVSTPGLLGNDFDVESGLTAAAVANPSSGTLSLDANGSFTYTPSAGFSGTDTFTYRASDGALDSNIAAVTITVAQAPPAPPPPPPPATPADQQPPTDPVIESTSHKLNVASSDRTIDLTWSGASDDQSGVDGFSFHWDNQPVSVPDTVKDAEETATGTTSPPLSNGIWYFHLRTRDNAGNWTTTRHVAPFVISVPPPEQVRCVVPNLKGKKVAQARGLLAAGRCTLARVTRAHSRVTKAGRIVSQSRPPGARLRRGTKVSVVVSSGPRR